MDQPPSLPQISPLDCDPAVPVYTCHIALARNGQTGRIRGRVINLQTDDPAFQVEGTSEREILKVLAARFKSHVAACHKSGQAVTLIESPEIPAGEVQRFLPVHL